MADSTGTGERPRVGRREWWLALVACLVLGAWPVRDALVPGNVALAVDTATAVQPWASVLADERAAAGVEVPRNPALSDQGVGFYPFYRWVLESWSRGDPPFWNPLVYVGAPGLGNPQYGSLDPQVLFLWPLWDAFGLDGFHLGLGLLAWWRIAFAAFGAYLLARALGLTARGAALAATTFGLSGYLVLWLNFSLGHVPPFLPWILLAVERCRGARPLRACAAVAALLGAAVLGGHPETAFYVGAAAGLWACAVWRDDWRAGAFALGGLALGTLLAAPSLLPFVEYLGRSAAQVVRETAVARRSIDWLAVGAGAVGLSLLVAGRPRAGERGAAGWARAIGIAGLVGGLAWLLRTRGLPPTAVLALVPDAFGRPGNGGLGYTGPGTYVEAASAWVPLVALGFALAAALSPSGALRRRGLVVALAFGAWLLALQAPGLLELKQRVPVVGLGATVRLAAVSALFLALLAGEGLDAAPAVARRAAGLALVAVGLAVGWPAASPPIDDHYGLDRSAEQDDLLGFARRPAERLEAGSAALEGWLHPELEVAAVRVRVERVTGLLFTNEPAEGTRYEVPTEFSPAPSEAARREAPDVVAAAPEGAVWFRTQYLQVSRLGEGDWQFSVVVVGPESGEPLAVRRAAVSRVERRVRFGWGSGALVGLGLAFLLVAPASGSLAWLAVALALVHGLWFARGQNPAAPASEAFPETATERVLARVLGDHRFFSEPGVLPPDTGMVRGLRALDGYDGLDVAQYAEYRRLALKPGVQALLGWNARGVDLDRPAYRLLGVGALALSGPLDHPRFELVAGPDGSGAPEFAECFVYRDREPYPRAYVATRVASPEQALALHTAGAWDPLDVVAWEQDWRPESPATTSSVRALEWRNGLVELEVSLDGDGLLVLTDQHFPGWVAEVDGEERAVHLANGLFRGVPLAAGEHRVTFRYRAASVRGGFALAALALAAVAGLLLWPAGRLSSGSPR